MFLTPAGTWYPYPDTCTVVVKKKSSSCKKKAHTSRFGNYASKVSMFTPISRLHTEHSIAVEQFASLALADSPDGGTLRALIREHLK